MDTNTQVVAIGKYIHRKLPDARVMFHDAGAIAYYGDGRGLRHARPRHEPPGRHREQRPGRALRVPREPAARARARRTSRTTRAWMGTHEFFGDVLLHTPLRPRHRAAPARRRRRHADHRRRAGITSAPASGRSTITRAGRSSIASTSPTSRASARTTGSASSAAATSAIRPRAGRSSSARRASGLIIDGGRTIRGGGEQFTVHVDPHEADAHRDPHRRPGELRRGTRRSPSRSS